MNRQIDDEILALEVRRKSECCKLQLYGNEVLEKIVKGKCSSGRIYLPKSWIGKKVKVISLD